MDNLKELLSKVDFAVPINGGPSSVRTSNHNPLEKEIISKVGKYVGLGFIANGGYHNNNISRGYMYWNNNVSNNPNQYKITLSCYTNDRNYIYEIFDFFNIGDFIHYKDFDGRSVYLKITDKEYVNSSNGDICLNVYVIGNESDNRFILGPNENSYCIIEVIKLSGNLINKANIDGSNIQDIPNWLSMLGLTGVSNPTLQSVTDNNPNTSHTIRARSFNWFSHSGSAFGIVTTDAALNNIFGNNAYGVSTNQDGGFDIMANQTNQPIRLWSGGDNVNPIQSASFNGTEVTFYGYLYNVGQIDTGSHGNSSNWMYAYNNGLLNRGNTFVSNTDANNLTIGTEIVAVEIPNGTSNTNFPVNEYGVFSRQQSRSFTNDWFYTNEGDIYFKTWYNQNGAGSVIWRKVWDDTNFNPSDYAGVNEINNIYDLLSAKANTRLSNVVGDLSSSEKSSLRSKLGVMRLGSNGSQFTLRSSDTYIYPGDGIEIENLADGFRIKKSSASDAVKNVFMPSNDEYIEVSEKTVVNFRDSNPSDVKIADGLNGYELKILTEHEPNVISFRIYINVLRRDNTEDTYFDIEKGKNYCFWWSGETWIEFNS